MTQSDLVLWGAASTRAMRVQWMLQELAVPFTFHPIQSRTGETQTTEYLALNPKGKIPTLRHGDLVISESAAIVDYLAATFELPPDFYVPANPGEQAKVDEWCYFVMTELDAHTLYVMRRHDGLKEIYGAAPEAVASAREYFLKQLGAVAGRVDDGGRYLFGDSLSTADILLMTCLDWARFYDIPLPEVYRRYQARVGSRPAYLKAFELTYPDRQVADAR